MKAYYKKTSEKTNEGQEIYHRVAGKGRPALHIKKGDRYQPWKRPLVSKKVVVVGTTVATAVADSVTA